MLLRILREHVMTNAALHPANIAAFLAYLAGTTGMWAEATGKDFYR